MTLQEALATQDARVLVSAFDAALAEVVGRPESAWSVYAVIDALEVADLLAAAMGRPPEHMSADTAALLVGLRAEVVTPDRVATARNAIDAMRSSPKLDEVMHSADPESWTEIYGGALEALG